jgi:hypothetical protein
VCACAERTQAQNAHAYTAHRQQRQQHGCRAQAAAAAPTQLRPRHHQQGAGKRKTYEGSWVQALNAVGISCAGIDNRGCGRSDGLFGYMEDHQLWVQDLVGGW